MRFFKLRPEDTGMMPIDRERFERATRKMPPWYQPSSSVTNRDSGYVDVNASFILHDCRAAPDGQVVEEMTFCIVTTRHRKPVEIHRKSIRFDVERFQRLIKRPEHGQRRRDLVELARHELGDLLGDSS